MLKLEKQRAAVPMACPLIVASVFMIPPPVLYSATTSLSFMFLLVVKVHTVRASDVIQQAL